MPVVLFSRKAESDLVGIGDYTIKQWGDQAAQYLYDLELCCTRLAAKPGLGRTRADIRPDLKRFEHGRHVIFYRLQGKGILVSRILHLRMLPSLHFADPKVE